MTEYNIQKDMFESYNNNMVTSYGPVVNGQNMESSYCVQAQQDSMNKTQYKKPFRTTHASRVNT